MLPYQAYTLNPSLDSGTSPKMELVYQFFSCWSIFSFWWSFFAILAHFAHFEELVQPQIQWAKHMSSKISNGTWQKTYLSTISLIGALFGMWDSLVKSLSYLTPKTSLRLGFGGQMPFFPWVKLTFFSMNRFAIEFWLFLTIWDYSRPLWYQS